MLSASKLSLGMSVFRALSSDIASKTPSVNMLRGLRRGLVEKNEP